MGISVGKVNAKGHAWAAGDRIAVTVDVKGDTSYPTNGTAITPSQFGLSSIHHFNATVEPSGTYLAAYDYANNKLKVFSALGTEVTNATDLSAVTWRCLVVGRGSPSLNGL